MHHLRCRTANWLHCRLPLHCSHCFCASGLFSLGAFDEDVYYAVEIRIPFKVHPDQRGMRHRTRERVALPPHSKGQYGGAVFVLLYLLFLVVFALPFS